MVPAVVGVCTLLVRMGTTMQYFVQHWRRLSEAVAFCEANVTKKEA